MVNNFEGFNMSGKIQIIISILLSFSGHCLASNYKIRSIEGAAYCGDQLLKVGEKLTTDCELNTQAKSNIYLNDGEDILAFGENVSGIVKGVGQIELNSGMLRIRNKNPLTIQTPMGKIDLVAGDYLSKASNFLNETEIVNFQGEAKLYSKIKDNDFVEILPGHWGGVGGRFSQQIGNLMKLDENQQKVFEVILN